MAFNTSQFQTGALKGTSLGNFMSGGFTPSVPTTYSNTQEDDTYNPRYPWFNKENYEKLERKVAQLWLTWSKKQEVMDEFYRQILPQVENEKKRSQRNEVINQKNYQVSQIKDESERKVAKNSLAVEELAQMVKEKENLREDAPDAAVFNAWIKSIPNWNELLANYMNKWDDTLLYKGWLKEESWWQKAWDFATWVLQSPWKWWYNIIWQWMDRLWKWWAEQLQGSDLQKWVQDKAVEMFGEDEVKRYQEEKAKQLEEWTAFKWRTQTDITKPILWEYRANNWYTKAWEVAWDIASWIALTAPMAAATAPYLASASLGEAASFGALQWLADTALTHYWSQWDLNVTPWEMAMWAVLGWLWWAATNKLANLNKVDDATNATKVATEKATKIADKTDDANKIAGRIWQWDIDDQKKVVEWVKSITKRSGKEWVKEIKTYSQLEDAIKNTEKKIIQEEDDLLKQFPEKIKNWSTTETVKWLWDQTDDVTRDFLDEWIELLKKYNKNDPVALKELDMMQSVKNTEWLTRLEAKNLARKLTTKLSKKFYNSNDELRNSMSAESYEKIRKWIQDAVRDRLPDDMLKNLDLEYSNLKTFEWLADDMTEKVNTLTQKLKEVWPIEQLGRKIWDAINFITGKGIKWLVEKFLPSNMWNKINNSIDMETELAKNLGKLVDINNAIDVLNWTINSSASKTATNKALNVFAKTINDIQKSITPTALNTATRWAEVISDIVYNN